MGTSENSPYRNGAYRVSPEKSLQCLCCGMWRSMVLIQLTNHTILEEKNNFWIECILEQIACFSTMDSTHNLSNNTRVAQNYDYSNSEYVMD